MNQPIQLGVNGAAGRMGQRIVALAASDPAFIVTGAYDSPDSPAFGNDAGAGAGYSQINVPITAGPEGAVDVVIDFSVPEAVAAIARTCTEQRIPLIVATTGLDDEQHAAVVAASDVTPVVFAPNMSVAVNLTMKLVREAARVLKSAPDGVDVEIIERHHRFKEDAPSGTALKFGEIVAEEMGQTQHVHGREGRPGPRPLNEIGYHALRTGDNVGEHTIVFGMMGETINLTVRGHTRDSYAYGALAAAKWIVNREPGLYSMADVLGM